MADKVVVVENGGGGGGGGGSTSPLKLTVRIDDPHVLANGAIRDGAIVSLAGAWTRIGGTSAVWTVAGPDGDVAVSSLTCDASWEAKACGQFTAALPGHYTCTLSVRFGSQTETRSAQFDVVAISTRQQATGKLTFLRAHDVGTGWGPADDHLNAEVIVKLDSKPGLAFGFQLRNDAAGPSRRAMLDLLRDAYVHDLRVTIDYDIIDLKHNGVMMRVALSR